MRAYDVAVGNTFKIEGIDDTEFIKFPWSNRSEVAVVTRDIIFKSRFGDDNNIKRSDVINKLLEEFLPRIEQAVGANNVHYFDTDLTALDGLNAGEIMYSKISLPTLDFYRRNVNIFDKYKPNDYWWLATPWSVKPHYDPYYIECVTPSGRVICNNYGNGYGVRPFLIFDSSIFVSEETDNAW